MQALNLSVPELLWRFPGEIETGVRAIPVIRNRIGPGMQANLSLFKGYIPFPETLVDGLQDPIAARLAPDLVLPRPLAANDLVLLDQNPSARAKPRTGNLWVVADGSGARVRYVTLGETRVYLGNEATLQDPLSWQSIPLQGRNILDIVRARIVWISREMEKTPPGPADPARGGD
jgi:hypothetical protein